MSQPMEIDEKYSSSPEPVRMIIDYVHPGPSLNQSLRAQYKPLKENARARRYLRLGVHPKHLSPSYSHQSHFLRQTRSSAPSPELRGSSDPTVPDVSVLEKQSIPPTSLRTKPRRRSASAHRAPAPRDDKAKNSRDPVMLPTPPSSAEAKPINALDITITADDDEKRYLIEGLMMYKEYFLGTRS